MKPLTISTSRPYRISKHGAFTLWRQQFGDGAYRVDVTTHARGSELGARTVGR